jgi:glycosyltransferase involved in cell wall biosynthesis
MVVDSLGVGGAERHVSELAIELQKRGREVTVACSAGGEFEASLENAGVRVHVLANTPVKRRLSPAYASALHRLLQTACFDVVHAHLYGSAGAAALAMFGSPLPLIVTQHSEARWQGARARAFNHWVNRQAAHVIAVSESIRNMMLVRFAMRAERVTLIPNAIPAHFPALPCSDGNTTLLTVGRASRISGSADFNVGVVARLAAEKGVDLFLEAAALVHRAEPGCRFKIAGDGALRGKLAELSRRLAIEDCVDFYGTLPDARPFIGELDLLVVPSLSEGAPFVTLEAMAAGVPIVATRVGGVPEQMRHEKEGLLVAPGDARGMAGACIRLIREPHLRSQLGEAGRLRAAAQFSHSRMVNDVMSVYQWVLGVRDEICDASRPPGPCIVCGWSTEGRAIVSRAC